MQVVSVNLRLLPDSELTSFLAKMAAEGFDFDVFSTGLVTFTKPREEKKGGE